jgi:hypothetical protein
MYLERRFLPRSKADPSQAKESIGFLFVLAQLTPIKKR